MATYRSTPPLPSHYVPTQQDPDPEADEFQLEDWVGSSVSSSDGREIGYIRAVRRTVGGPEIVVGESPEGGRLRRISAVGARRGPFSIELPRSFQQINRGAIAVRETRGATPEAQDERPSWRRGSSTSGRLPLRDLAVSATRKPSVAEKIGKPDKLVGRKVRDAAGEQIGWVRATREIDGNSFVEISPQRRGPSQRYRLPVEELIPVERHLYVAANRGQILRDKSYSLRFAGPQTAFEPVASKAKPVAEQRRPSGAAPAARSGRFDQVRRRPVLVGN